MYIYIYKINLQAVDPLIKASSSLTSFTANVCFLSLHSALVFAPSLVATFVYIRDLHSQIGQEAWR